MKYTFYFLVISAVTLVSCKLPIVMNDSIMVVEPKIIGGSTNSEGDMKNYYYNTIHSIYGNHVNFRTDKDQEIVVLLTQTEDSVLIYDAVTNIEHRVMIPVKFHIPVDLIYFHNYDSIFVFFDREYIVMSRQNGVLIDDIILFNSSSTVLNTFSLDSVPYIYNGQLNPMILVRRDAIMMNLISNEKLFIPFGLYLPEISDTQLAKLDIRLLCELNLVDKQLKMLNVTIPDSDIGNTYNENVLTGNFDFRILNDSCVIYSWTHLPSIFKLNPITNTTIEVQGFEDLPFNNKPNGNDSLSDFVVRFSCPQFSSIDSVFIRQFQVEGYKDFASFSMAQVFDSELKLVGYSIENAQFSKLFIDRFGQLAIAAKNEGFKVYNIKIDMSKEYKISEMESEFLLKKPKSKQILFSTSLDSPFDQRMKSYISGVTDTSKGKYVFIYTDVVCGECIDYIMQYYHNEMTDSCKNDFFFVFYGSNISFADELIKMNKLNSTKVIIDLKMEYLKYFNPLELHNCPLVYLNEVGDITVETYSYEDIRTKLLKFVNM